MKKLLFAILTVLFVFNTGTAQDAAKSFKAAKKAMKSYLLENAQNDAKLQEVVTNLAAAASDAEISSSFDYLRLKGDANLEISKKLSILKQTGLAVPDDFPKVDMPALEAFNAYKMALDKAEKKYQRKKALAGLLNAQGELNNQGYFAYTSGDYDAAYKNFAAIIDADKILKENKAESTLTDDEKINDLKYTVATTAKISGHNEVALKLFEELLAAGYEKAGIYEGLFNLLADTDMDAAYKYLATGREKYPDETSLLFAEINYYLKLNKLEELIDKLKLAVEKEPDNASIYSTLGNVYDQLYQKEAEAKNTEKAEEYFNKALEQFNLALEKKPDYFDAIYSIGALYYNKAAAITVEMNEITGWDKASIAKSKELKAKADEEFAKALPFFQKAEMINPNDANTLIALKEIAARNNNFELSNEFKARLEKVQAGGKNETSYFAEKN